MDITPNNRGTAPQQAPQSHVASQRAYKRRRPLVGGVAALVVIILIVLGGWLWWSSHNTGQTKAAAIDKSGYQAVFLTNGQVYFGKLQSTAGDYLQLTNIYYLQVQQSVQPSTDKPADQGSNDQKTQLVKLGNELHGPQDSMQISNKQVLFWENLKSDGKVSKAISSYKP